VAETKLFIRPMKHEDIAEVLKLEADTLVAWSRTHLENELQQPAGFQFVATDDAEGKVLGVLCGRIAADEAEILKLGVTRNARRKGVGAQLLDYALDYCSGAGAKNCYLELRASNKAAARLYEKRGFSLLGIREKYYNGPCEDAIMMRLHLKQTTKI
jgi:ribosomal-protein-alanine acetyltransferase